MRKTYEQRMQAYRDTCVSHAQLETVYIRFDIDSNRAEAAYVRAVIAARWVFLAHPELREAR
jgi:hypothetical protein